MANTKLSQITNQLADPVDTDRLYSVDMDAGLSGSAYTTFADARKMRVFDTETARNTAIPSPVEGYQAFVRSLSTITVWDSAANDWIPASLGEWRLEPSGGLDTTAIQAAIDAATAAGGGTVRLTRGTYSTRELILKSGVYIMMEPGTVLGASSGYAADENIIEFEAGATDCGIVGYGSKLTMASQYAANQFRSGIRFTGNYNVILAGFTVEYCGGDGIQMTGPINTNVAITNVVSQYNGRQGISILSADNVSITHCSFIFTGKGPHGGDAPMAGIDVEPETGYYIRNLNISDCQIGNNRGNGFSCNPNNLDDESILSLTLSNCEVFNNAADGIEFLFLNPSHYGMGRILVSGCNVEDTGGLGLSVVDWAAADIPITVSNCRFKDSNCVCGADYEYQTHASIYRLRDSVNTYQMGDLKIMDCDFVDDRTNADTGYFNFSSGSGTEPAFDAIVNDATNGGTGMVHNILLFSGSWGEGTADGRCYLRKNSGTFGTGATASFTGGATCTIGTTRNNFTARYSTGYYDYESSAECINYDVINCRHQWKESTWNDTPLHLHQSYRVTPDDYTQFARLEAAFNGSPVDTLSAKAGSCYVQRDGGDGLVRWYKQSNESNEGWDNLAKRDSSIWIASNGTDDTANLQAAIVELWQAGGGNLNLYEGNYYVDQVRVYDNVYVNMAPGTVINPTASFSGPYLFYFYEAINGVKNAGINGNGGMITFGQSYYTDRAIGIPGNADGITIDNVRFFECADAAILLLGATPKNVTIRDCIIEYSYNSGIYLSGCDQVLIDNCIIRNCGTGVQGSGGSSFAIYALAGTDALIKNVVVRDCLIENNLSGGLLVNISAQTTAECSMLFRGCKFVYSGVNLQNCLASHTGGGLIVFEGCTVEDAYAASFTFTEWFNGSVHTIISNCESKNCNVAGSTFIGNRTHVSFLRSTGSANTYDMGNVLISGCYFLSTYDATWTAYTDYSAGINAEPQIGELATDDTTGATGIVATITVTAGDWGSGNASGVIRFRQVTGAFGNGNTINFAGGGTARCDSPTAVQVPTKCVYGDVETSSGEIIDVLLKDPTIQWAQSQYNDHSSFVWNITNSKIKCDVTYAGDPSAPTALTASPGSRYFRTDGGANTTFYLKETGDDGTGWAAK